MNIYTYVYICIYMCICVNTYIVVSRDIAQHGRLRSGLTTPLPPPLSPMPLCSKRTTPHTQMPQVFHK